MEDNFEGNSCIDVEKAKAEEGAGCLGSKSNATQNALNNINNQINKSIDRPNAEKEANKQIQKFMENKEAMRQSIASNLKVFFPNNEIIECRIILKDKQGICFGYFSDVEELSKTAIGYDRNDVLGIYVTLNPVEPALLARSINRIKIFKKGDHTTTDKDTLERKWLLIDIDPKRPSGVSSTDREHENAINATLNIEKYLTTLGWPKPVVGDSGNGAGLLYRIDLPAIDSTVEKVLKALGKRFTDECISVDESVSNPSRIRRLYGTMNRKGDNLVGVSGIDDRPWRVSNLISIPEKIEAVSKEQMEELIKLSNNEENTYQENTAKKDESTKKEQSARTKEKASDRLVLNSENFNNNLIIVEGVLKSLEEIGIKSTKKDYNGGFSWDLDQCPMSNEHSDGSYIQILPSGAIAAGCQHNHCKKKWGWKDVRARYDRNYKDDKNQNKIIKPMEALIEVVDYLVNKDEDARLIYTSIDEPYLWVKIGDHFEMLKLNPKNKAFKMFLFSQVKEKYGLTLRDDETFKNALLAIEYTAKEITERKGFDLYPSELGFRCTWYNDSAWIDSCGSKWTGIKINEDGFIKSELPPIFLRTSLQKEIVEPNYQARPEDFDKIFKYINVLHKSHRLLVKTWICAAMVPRFRNRSIAQPWLSFTGITSAGKTKAGQYAKKIVDPIKGDQNGSDKTPLPHETKDLAVVLNNSQVVLFDNTGKRISNELSDLLCVAVTRGCFRTRKLYSDDEEALLNLSSAIIMTSIAYDSLNEDLLNRMIPIELKGFDKDNKRKPELLLDEAFEKDLPDILGGAYCSLSKAFGNIDKVYEDVSKLEEAPRLLDFAVMGEALSCVWGENKGSFIKAYNEAQGKKSAENITASPVINSLVGYIKGLKKGAKYNKEAKRFDYYQPYTFYGPISKILTPLKEYYAKENGSYPNENMWPQSSKAFGNKIKESMMGLKNSGVDVIIDERQTSGVYYYTIKYLGDDQSSLNECAW